MGSMKTKNCLNGQEISQPFLPEKRCTIICVERMRICPAVNFKITHIAGSVNTAADFLSRLELKVREKIRLRIREDVQTTSIEVTKTSSDVADEEQLFFTQPDGEDETEEQTLEREENSRRKATEWLAHEKPSARKTSIKELTKIDGNTTSYHIHGIKANARIQVEQDVDLVLKISKLKKLGQPFDEVLLATDKQTLQS